MTWRNWTGVICLVLAAILVVAPDQSRGDDSSAHCMAELDTGGMKFTMSTNDTLFAYKFYSFMRRDNETFDLLRCRRAKQEAEIDCEAGGSSVPFQAKGNKSLTVFLPNSTGMTTSAVYKMGVNVNDTWTPFVVCRFKQDVDADDHNQDDNDSSADDRTVVIVGCTVGIATVIVLIVIVGVTCFFRKRKRSRGAGKTIEEQPPASDPLIQSGSTGQSDRDHEGSDRLNGQDTSIELLPVEPETPGHSTIDGKEDFQSGHDEQDNTEETVPQSPGSDQTNPSPCAKPEWFFLNMSRHRAHNLLKFKDNKEGCFLIWTSDKEKKHFLSVLSRGKPSTYVIYFEEGKYFIESGSQFDHLRELVNHYTEEKGCLPTKLGLPCVYRRIKRGRTRSLIDRISRRRSRDQC